MIGNYKPILKDVKVVAYMSKELKDWLYERAKEQNMSVSTFVGRDLLLQYRDWKARHPKKDDKKVEKEMD